METKCGGHMYVENRSRMIGFSPTDEYFAKGCFGITGTIPVPTLQPGQPNVFLSNLFQTAQQLISEEAQVYQGERDLYTAAMEQGKAAIETVVDPDTAKTASDLIAGLSHALTSKRELRALFNKRIKERDIQYNKESACFERAEA